MNKKKYNEKGFALTYDSMIGIVLLLMVIIFIGRQSFDIQSSTILVQKNLADDLVEVSISTNILQDYNVDDVNNFFEETLPSNYQYRLTIDTYEGSGGTLVEGPAYTYGDDVTDPDSVDYIESRGAFLNFPASQSADIENYNLVKLRIWVKESVRQREE